MKRNPASCNGHLTASAQQGDAHRVVCQLSKSEIESVIRTLQVECLPDGSSRCSFVLPPHVGERKQDALAEPFAQRMCPPVRRARVNAGGRSRFSGQRVGAIRISDTGKGISFGADYYRVTSQSQWRVLDRLFAAAQKAVESRCAERKSFGWTALADDELEAFKPDKRRGDEDPFLILARGCLERTTNRKGNVKFFGRFDLRFFANLATEAKITKGQ